MNDQVLQRRLCRSSSGYLKEHESIDLLSARDLSRLFARGIVKRSGLPISPNNRVPFSQSSGE